ncbi:MAG: hypothetical protein ABIS50_10715 [Luteolibacter sp.]|uniref:hypothetical protein n=1 Tax=Luteolibacter sp. TaxID=1962973 RepID=UPI003267892D
MSESPPQSSANHADYQAAFLGHVHRLLQLAYESLTPADYQTSEEDDITGDLCNYMKYLTEDAPTSRWMLQFSVHDQDPVNNIKAVKTDQPRKGKRRPRLDIRLVSKTASHTQRFCIEAKRLYRSDSVSEYVDDAGVGAFVSGEYASDDDFGGMLGYIQTESLEYWVPKIEAKIRQLPSVQKFSKEEKWSKVAFRDGPKNCFKSHHSRETGRPITLLHVKFPFTSVK